jgi:transposase-like protein
VTPAGKIERLEVPREREGEFVTQVFERYNRMTGDVEEAILEMYLSGISVSKIAGVTDALSRVKVGKDAVSRIARRLEEGIRSCSNGFTATGPVRERTQWTPGYMSTSPNVARGQTKRTQ